MRKKIVVGLIIILISMALYNKKIYAIIGDVSTDDIKLCTITHVRDNNGGDKLVVDTDEKNEKLEELKKYGYQGDNILYGDNSMKFVTKIHKLADKTAFFEYKIQIGGEIPDGKTGIIKYVSEEDLINKYGYDKNEDSWPVVLIGGAQKDSVPTGELSGIAVVAKKVYAGDDYEKGLQITTDSEKEVESTDILRASEVGGILKNALNDVLAKLFIMLIEFIRALYGDGPQMLLNTIQTSQYETGISKFLPWKITYSADDYLNSINKNQYVMVSTDGSNTGSKAEVIKEVSASENEFDKDTEIPVIPVEVYTLSVGQISALDINFLTGQNNTELHSPDSVWIKLRNLASGIIHFTIYIGAAFLIATLIWHGICIVRTTLTPEAEKKHKDGIHNFAIAVAMLVGSIIIMAVCIFFSKIVFEDMEVASTKELPIRIVLTDNGSTIYSFSTNVTGYARYMSETQNTSLIVQKLKYTVVYIICVWLNIISVLIMIIRLVAIIVLSVTGPIIAVSYAVKKSGDTNESYKTWAMHYALWSSIQLIFGIAYRIILEVAF